MKQPRKPVPVKVVRAPTRPAQIASPARLLLAGARVILLALALLVWERGLRTIDLTAMNDLGLVSVLPWTFFAALGLLTVSFCLGLRQRAPSAPLPLLHLLALILILYGTPSLIEEVPRFESVWKHIGVSEYISRTGTIAPEISAYFEWPGFFILLAFGTELIGASDPLGLAMWFPTLINLCFLAAVLLILKAGTHEPRTIWLGAWFFSITNWIGQDYLSPQALSYFFYLMVIAVLLGWFKANPVAAHPDAARIEPTAARRWPHHLRRWLAAPEAVSNKASNVGQRVGLLAIVLTILAAIIVSHQLTPFVAIGSLAALALVGRIKLRSLPLLLAIATASWLSFMANAYLTGNAAGLIGALGQIGSAVDENVTNRLRGSPEHIVVIYSRLTMSVAIWGLALLGGLRLFRQGQRPVTFAILALTPFFLIIAQPYGGEMLLRVYLFVLPFMAFFAASAFYGSPQAGRTWATTSAIALVSITLLGGFMITRYGNERADNFTASEVASLRQFYEIAEPDSLVMTVAENMPFRFRRFEQFTYQRWLAQLETEGIDQLIARLEQGDYRQRYLILTRSQRAAAELLYGLPPSEWDRFSAEVQASPRFRAIVATADVQAYLLVDERGGGRP